jgi:hypothetical protein
VMRIDHSSLRRLARSNRSVHVTLRASLE